MQKPFTRFSRLLSVLLAISLTLVFAAGLTACKTATPDRPSSSQWTQDYLEVMRLPPEEAEAALEELINRAPNQEKAREARFQKTSLTLRRGDIEAARQGFQKLWDDKNDDNTASRAIYELARIAAEHDEDGQEARRLLTTAIVDTPPWAGSEFALDYLIRTERRASRTDELATHINSMATTVKDDRMGARLHLEHGLLLADRSGQANAALDAFRAAHKRCRECAATDDALVAMAEIYTRHQSYGAAVQALNIVANRTQRSFFVGTYSSHRASDSRFALGEIELIYRRDYSAATGHFRTFIRDFPYDPRADDAAWYLVEIERESGSTGSHRRALRRFLRNYPESRHAPRAQKRIEEMT